MAQGDRANRFGIGRVLTQSLSLIVRRAPMLLVLTVVIGWLPRIAMAQIRSPLVALGQWNTVAWLAQLGIALLHMLLSELLLICVVHAMLADGVGFIATLGATAKAAFARLLPLVPLTLILDAPSLTQVLAALRYSPLLAGSASQMSPITYSLIWGMVSLVAAIWILAWVGVAGAVFIEELLPAIPALRRAAKLMDHERWRFMALWIPFALIMGALIVGLNLPLLRASAFAVARRQLDLNGLESAFFDALWAVFIAVTYRELCRLKDNPASEVADVFD